MHFRGYFPVPEMNQDAIWPKALQRCYDLGHHAKEQFRKTILKHESVFRHQVYELHRLYKVQREMTAKEILCKSNFQERSKTLEEHKSFESKCRMLRSRFCDLENPSENRGWPCIRDGRIGVDAPTPSLKEKIVEMVEISSVQEFPGREGGLKSGMGLGFAIDLNRSPGLVIGAELHNDAELSKHATDAAAGLNRDRVPINTQSRHGSRPFIDLNVSADAEMEYEDDYSVSNDFMRTVGTQLKTDESTELESKCTRVCCQDSQRELVYTAAEALVSISSSDDVVASRTNPLLWLAELVSHLLDGEPKSSDQFEIDKSEYGAGHNHPLSPDTVTEESVKKQRRQLSHGRESQRDAPRSVGTTSWNDASRDLEPVQKLVEAGGGTWGTSPVGRKKSGKRCRTAASGKTDLSAACVPLDHREKKMMRRPPNRKCRS